MVNLYLLLAGFAIAYLGFLTVLNLIPHLTIKYIGLFSLRGITIDTKKSTIYIRKLSLKFNIFKTNRTSGYKLVNLEIVDVSITLKETPADGGTTKVKPKSKEELKRFPLLMSYISKYLKLFMIIYAKQKSSIESISMYSDVQFFIRNCLVIMLLFSIMSDLIVKLKKIVKQDLPSHCLMG